MKQFILSIVFFIFVNSIYSQINKIEHFQNKSNLEDSLYVVSFIDKNNSPYSLNNPLEYLSQRAVDRRLRHNIAITEDDFPVNPSYLQAITEAGAIIKHSSRWLNFAIIYANNESLNNILNLECVKDIIYISPGCVSSDFIQADNQIEYDKFALELEQHVDIENDKNSIYGEGLFQLEQINGLPVHEAGYKGEGVVIAVLDAGFLDVDSLVGLEHLFDNDKIVYTKNLVNPNNDVYTNTGTHGTMVLSTMAAKWDNNLIGTAPEASYALIVSEEQRTETLIEECQWVVGAELADSLGADIINSSLSYTLFDDANMNHSFEDMDGATCVASIAAEMAIDRGIYIAASAGNSNTTAWPYVGTPADAENVATVGAVDRNNNIAYFSSIGFENLNFLKPDYLALGVEAAVIKPYQDWVSYANGTSFSSPISCGMTACLIQADNTVHPVELKRIINESCNMYPNHEIDYGYGIPDFYLAMNNVVNSIKNYDSNEFVKLYPNPASEYIIIKNDKNNKNNIESIMIYSLTARLIKSISVNNSIMHLNIAHLPVGIYMLKIFNGDGTIVNKKLVVK